MSKQNFNLPSCCARQARLILSSRNRFQDQVRDLFSRLAEDRFNLVVVGRFSRGKTSLMNAVLGADRLPTGIRPITSVIRTVTYGSTEKSHYTLLWI